MSDHSETITGDVMRSPFREPMNASVSQLELRVLSNISKIVGHALNLDQTLELILEILSKDLSMNRATITLKDSRQGGLSIRASHGLTSTEKQRGVYRMNEGVTGHIFRTGEPFVVPDVSMEPLFLNKTGSRRFEKGRISFIGVPIVLHGQPIGVLSVDRLFDEEVSFEEDITFLTILATLVAQLASLNDQVLAREDYLVRANISLKTELSKKCSSFMAVSESPAMDEVQRLIKKVAPTNATVLLLGESGTGKTLVAQIIHELSERSRFPFVKVNCAALPDNLLESELFGYEKGAFTGATDSKLGRMEEAAGGTVFLDEIGELAVALQAKLLRFLQDREFERLGSTKTRKVDVRVVAATNKNLNSAVLDGRFRQDLFYRLNVFPIRLPPLRERADDVEELIHFFADRMCRQYGCELNFTDSALVALKQYEWPGNVREMENLIERLAIMWERGAIDTDHLNPYIAGPCAPSQPHHGAAGIPQRSGSLRELEKNRVLLALERNNWIQSRAAKELGITLRQMGYRVKKYELEDLVKERRAGRHKASVGYGET